MNLLLLSVDSLRWDAVARTHPDRVHTPRFDHVSGHFAFTDRCFSVSTATRPVHQSLFSGLYPFEHGLTGQHRRHRRMRIPRLLDALRQRGHRVAAFSEAATILAGVDLGTEVQALDPRAGPGLQQLRCWLAAAAAPCTLFVHYWCTHAPYGAADGRALGATADLIRRGRADIVVERYRHAVSDCFEHRIAPLLEQLDLGAWAVLLFGDHGERWVEDELYHGRTLHHDVLRVPLFLHVPHVRAQPSGPVCSLIDIYATLAELFTLPAIATHGRDLLAPAGRLSPYLAQIEPTSHTGHGPGAGCLAEAPPESEESRMLWAVFDEHYKWTWAEPSPSGVWSRTFDPADTPLDRAPPLDAAAYLQRVRVASPHVAQPLCDGIDADVLEGRLRDLGYLD